jgi:hypothetical protein
MDRRVFLCDAGAVALGTAWQVWPIALAFAGLASRANGAERAPGVAVFDPTLAEGRMLAQQARRAGYLAWSVGDSDIGALWHAQLAHRLEPGASLIGALRPSDRFVLARLATSRSVTLHRFSPTHLM